MIVKIKCDCGHFEYGSAVEKFEGKTLCRSCWKSFMELKKLFKNLHDGKFIKCQSKGCNESLSIIKTGHVLILVCPMHGVIYRVIIYQEEGSMY